MFDEPVFFILGALLNLVIALIIVRFIYYPATRDKNHVFTFLAFNAIVYFVAGLFTSTELSVGAGFGLFAIFSLLRYRTEEMPIREMTYLFVIISLPIINSILIANEALLQLFLANGMMVALLYVLEKQWGFHFEASTKITYEKIDLISPANREELLTDLRQRTGLPIKRVDVGRLDFVHDSAEIRIYYDETQLSGLIGRPQPGIDYGAARHQPTQKSN